ncbi:MAG TPA: beta-ketoacyl synthase N-terminal-like domain-containing protein, partial [Rhodocyclaceae bacterium]|nr:beta-ketoacyl synthase N-terminal-like domain-containing protein [Rhodocyclaceae bacterium]
MSEVENKKAPELTPMQKAALAVKELRSRLDAVEGAQREPIAIIGMSCRFPQSDGPDGYWRTLAEGRDAIREVPPERWDLDRFFDPNPNAAGKISTRYGGFIDDVDRFDAAFFGVSPSEAERMDPQQRLLMELSWHALEDAGIAPLSLRGSRTGVFVGMTQMDYGVMQLGGPVEDILAYTGTGNGLCFSAGRLAFFYGLHGPTFAMDTACSSSMVALHQACTALRNRECDLAIVAGAQLNLTPPMQIFLSKTQSFAPDGRCRTFDEAANGFVLGEGVGVIVLRRLSDAQTRRERVRASIRASGVNHDGPASGLTVPNEMAQEALIRSTIERARLAPSDIDYVEAHGTGTELGDPIEVGAMRAVFGERDPQQPLLIGSVKTNLGHLNAAAGMAGLMKVVLMLQNEQVAPNLHFKQPSSRIRWQGFTARVPTELTPWPRSQRPRRAGVSSFGLSGTNVHVVLEEAPLPLPPAGGDARPLHLLTLSARNEKALRELAQAYRDLPDDLRLADICYSANTGRSALAWRLAIRAATRAELRERLSAFIDESSTSEGTAGLWCAQIPKGGAGRLAMLFADDIAVDAVRALAQTQPTVAATLAQCEELYRGGVFVAGLHDGAAVLACQLAMVDLWANWGVRPAAVAGWGVGELSALCVAGALDRAQAFRAVGGEAVDAASPQMAVYGANTQGGARAFAAQPGYRWQRQSPSNQAATAEALATAGFKISFGVGATAGLTALRAYVKDMLVAIDDADLWHGLLETLAQAYLRGVAVDWEGFDAGYARRKVKLPGYRFQGQRFWLDFKPEAAVAVAAMAASCAVPTARPAALAPAVSVGWADKPNASAESVGRPKSAQPTPAVGLSHLLGNQLEAAATAINEVVAQQLQFLRNRMASAQPAAPAAVPPAPTFAPEATQPELPSTPKPPALLASTLGDWHLLMLAADDKDALEKTTEAWLADGDKACLYGKVGTGKERRLLVHNGLEDARTALGVDGKRDPKRIVTMTARASRSVVFMFPGVGDHYLRMGQGLYRNEAVFRAEVDRCCDLLQPLLGSDLREVVYPPQSAAEAPAAAAPKMDLRAMLGRGAAPVDPAEARLNQTVHSQPLVFIMEYALGRLWQARGLQPQAMIGYSVGE